VAIFHNQYSAAKKIALVCGLLVIYQFSAHAQQYGWTVLATPNPGNQMHAVEFKDTLHGWCEAGGQIYWTTDGGHNWTASVTQSFGVLAISMSDTLNGWAVGYNGSAPSESKILHTTDGGKNWIDQLYIQNRRYFDVCALSKQRAIVSGTTSYQAVRDTATIVQTTDGGSLWIESTHTDSITSLGNIQFIDSLHGWMFGGYYSVTDQSNHYGFLRTTNGGSSWDIVKQLIYDFSFVDTLNGFAYTGHDDNGLFIGRTRDGGLTWQPRYIPYVSVYNDRFTPSVVSFVDTLNGWMFCNTVFQGDFSIIIVRTTDGGMSWTQESIGLARIVGDGAMVDRHHGWVVTHNGEVLGYGLLTGIVEHLSDLPTGFLLRQNYPNPFNNSTVIEYEILKGSDVHIAVYDGIGKLVSTLVNQYESPGMYRIEFDAQSLSSGIYYYRMNAGTFSNTKQLILLK
jgi:photosystem II stability/assembly factor-like uncharacterized protein